MGVHTAQLEGGGAGLLVLGYSGGRFSTDQVAYIFLCKFAAIISFCFHKSQIRSDHCLKKKKKEKSWGVSCFTR